MQNIYHPSLMNFMVATAGFSINLYLALD